MSISTSQAIVEVSGAAYGGESREFAEAAGFGETASGYVASGKGAEELSWTCCTDVWTKSRNSPKRRMMTSGAQTSREDSRKERMHSNQRT